MLHEAWDGFGRRMLRLNPFFSLGRGMELGVELNPYVHGILFRVILELFYRELNDREDRRRIDIEEMVSSTINVMGLTATEAQIQRLASGLLYQGNEQLNKSFDSLYFNESKKAWEITEFRYVTMDPLFSDLAQGGGIVYKLTEEAQEMIFMSREISEAFSITVEQLYSLQLIKNKNYKKATRSLELLLSRVRRLIAEEKEFQQEIANDPKVLVLNENKQREENKEAIEKQFESEKKEFRNILALIDRLQAAPDHMDYEHDLPLLREMVERTRAVHDQFARHVIQSIAMEMRLKSENPALFWDRGSLSFTEHLYESYVVSGRMQSTESAYYLLAPLFSPRPEFMLPLPWLWVEQEEAETVIEEEEEMDEEEREEVSKRTVNWPLVTTAWEPVFLSILENGSFALSQLPELSESAQALWVAEDATRELWMLFTREPMTIEAFTHRPETLQAGDDEREVLLSLLMQKNSTLKALLGKKLISDYDPMAQPLMWGDVTMTPFLLTLT